MAFSKNISDVTQLSSGVIGTFASQYAATSNYLYTNVVNKQCTLTAALNDVLCYTCENNTGRAILSKILSVGAGTWAAQALGGQLPYAFEYFNSSGTNGDYIYFDILLPAGTYTIKTNGYKGGNRGIREVLVDDVSKGTYDYYAAVDAGNTVSTYSIGSLTAGVHRIKIKNTGKNAASTGYYQDITEILIERTA